MSTDITALAGGMPGKAEHMTKRGRPAGTTKDFRTDPDRFAVALIDAVRATGLSERQACDYAAGVIFGRQVPPSSEAISQVKPGWEMRTFELPNATVDGKASTLRKKATKAISKEEVAWRSSMSSAFFLALFRQDLPFGQLRDAIRLLCSMAGEPLFAEVLLQGMIAPRNLPGELFSEVFTRRNVINGQGRFPLIDARPDDPHRPKRPPAA